MKKTHFDHNHKSVQCSVYDFSMSETLGSDSSLCFLSFIFIFCILLVSTADLYLGVCEKIFIDMFELKY